MGRKWNIRFGYFTSSLLRTKPPASKWFVAPAPLRKNNHRKPIHGRFHIFSDGCWVTGCEHECWIYTSR